MAPVYIGEDFQGSTEMPNESVDGDYGLMAENSPVIIRKVWTWTIVCIMFEECHSFCSLNISSVDFPKIVAAL